jgi:hypothetical protein
MSYISFFFPFPANFLDEFGLFSVKKQIECGFSFVYRLVRNLCLNFSFRIIFGTPTRSLTAFHGTGMGEIRNSTLKLVL